jgi:hypothetical protein
MRIDSLEDPESFAATTFWEALGDQATYTVTRRDMGASGWPTRAVKLVGLLGTAFTSIHPRFF